MSDKISNYDKNQKTSKQMGGNESENKICQICLKKVIGLD
jgi:hypothetical protein